MKIPEFVTINTYKGLFQCTRLLILVFLLLQQFSCMENVFQGCKGVSVYLDDLLVTGSTVKEHLENPNKVLGIMATAGLTLNLTK